MDDMQNNDPSPDTENPNREPARKNKKIIAGGSIVLLAVIVGTIWFAFIRQSQAPVESESNVVAQRKLLVVGDNSFPPFTIEENGEVTGIDLEVFGLVMERLGIEYEVDLLPWNRALKLIEIGEADALLSAAYSDDRASFIDYTPEQRAHGVDGATPRAYLHATDGVLFVRTLLKDVFHFESVDQVARDGYRVGVNQGYRYSVEIDNADWNKTSHVAEEDSFTALLNGEIDVLLAYKDIGLTIREELGLQDEISVVEGPPPFRNYLFLVFSKNSDYPDVDGLQRRIDEEFIKIHESGEYEEIYNSYTQ